MTTKEKLMIKAENFIDNYTGKLSGIRSRHKAVDLMTDFVLSINNLQPQVDQLIEKWGNIKNELGNLTIGFDDQYQVGFIDGEVNTIDEIIEDLKTLTL